MIPPRNNSFSKFKYLEDDENYCSSGFRHSHKGTPPTLKSRFSSNPA